MATYQTPGVYVEEVSSGSKPIAGVGTGTGGFVGIAQRGPVGKAILVTNWSQYTATFGGHVSSWYMSYAVKNFFAEGGSKCYVVRTVHYTDISLRTSKTSKIATYPNPLSGATATDTILVEATSDGTWGNNLKIKIDKGTDVTKYKITVLTGTTELEKFDNVELAKINEIKSNYVVFTKNGTPSVDVSSAAVTYSLAGGAEGLTSIAISDFSGDGSETALNGLHAFDPIDEVNLISMPDMHVTSAAADNVDSKTGIQAGYAYCKNRGDCFFIAETPSGLTPSEAKTFKSALASDFGAIYYPWVNIAELPSPIPPSGAIMGIFSRTDRDRGVHKAPAGITDGFLSSAVGLERLVTAGEQEILNPNGVNVIRSFPGAGICSWGARTMSSDPEWKYINIRRMFLYIEESIDEATQWVVFEPNSPSLWGSVKRNIVAFLTRSWLDGMFFGATPDEAFFVKIDEENNPEAVRNAGQLVIEIGVAPIRPAEFVIIRIFQKTQEQG